MWNLANALTLSRFVLAPIFLVLMMKLNRPDPTMAWAALGVVILTLLSDLFDGMVARAQNQVTDFGKIMDPVADSTFFLTALFAFSACDRTAVPIWLPMIVLYREVAMHVLRRYAALRGIVLAARWSGKTKMVIQCIITVALLLLLAAADSHLFGFTLSTMNLRTWMFWGAVIIAVVNVVSLLEYLATSPDVTSQP
ncbi:MAG: CDP-alcohol phosphatidyltransferase family protein [Planctomycetota bacterium]|jgi:CDP-diacylglycerol--glycerol-3-phosphate 3-phosphatidyltransferase